MNRKLFVSIVALLAVGVVAAAAPGAQANAGDPHWFSGGLTPPNAFRIAPATRVPVFSFGTLTITNLSSKAQVTCQFNMIKEQVENPAPGTSAGPPGVGEIETFTPIVPCQSEACTPATTGGGQLTYISVVPEPAAGGTTTNLKWKSHLFEAGPGQIRSEGEYRIKAICHVEHGLDQSGNPIFTTVTQEATGLLAPLLITACNPPGGCVLPGSPIPQAEFGSGAGVLLTPASEQVKFEGSLGFLGWNAVEIINAQAGLNS